MRGIGFDVGIGMRDDLWRDGDARQMVVGTGMRDDLWRDGDARQMVVGTGMRDKLLSGWGCATT
jgi:hypothetical protein